MVLAQLEADLARERTLAGLERARAEGKRPGPKPKVNAEQLAEALRLQAAGESVLAISKALGIPRSTIHRAMTRDARTEQFA